MDATTLSENFTARERATAELRALTDEYAGKDMPAEARQTETRLIESITDFDGRIKRGIEAIKASESMAAAVASLKADKPKDTGPDWNTELRGLELGKGVSVAPDKGLTKVGRELRAVDTTSGRNVIPRSLFGQLLAEAVERSTVMAAGATIMTTAGGEPLDFAVVTGRAQAQITAENAAIAESNPSLTTRSMGAYKYAYASIVSSELVSDQALDLVGFLVSDAGPALGHGMGVHFLAGTGTGQPKGVLNAASPAAATWTQGATDGKVSDALIDLYYELPQSYRSNAVFVVSDKTAATMRKLKDNNGQYLWQSSIQAGAPDVFNGRPVYTDPAAPDGKVLFADLSKYRVRLAGSLRIERSLEHRFMNDQVAYRFVQRADGLLTDERSAKVLTVTAKA